ncbi:hypothetical protein V1477_018992 [Vespula maculifrons]|uniref:Uncharacterized protein n=1 Tax=Vespula maculifrons TaxID=7453 RepID=A0ABD2AV10_VESMC
MYMIYNTVIVNVSSYIKIALIDFDNLYILRNCFNIIIMFLSACKNFIRLRVHSFLLSQIQTSLKHMKYSYLELYCMKKKQRTKPINYLVKEKNV